MLAGYPVSFSSFSAFVLFAFLGVALCLPLSLLLLCRFQPFFDDNPMGIYEKILAAKIAFPPHIDSITKDLIRRLLTVDRSKRLGNLRGGAMDVMMHPWFSGVDWGSLERRQIRAPIIPPVADVGEFRDVSFALQTKRSDFLLVPLVSGDTQNFQKYPLPRPDDLPGLFAVAPAPDVYGQTFEVRRRVSSFLFLDPQPSFLLF